MFCNSCGTRLDNDALFCTNCGEKVSYDELAKHCVHCGCKLEDDAIFCSNCGKRIREEQPHLVSETNLELMNETENKIEITEKKDVPQRKENNEKPVIVENIVSKPTNDTNKLENDSQAQENINTAKSKDSIRIPLEYLNSKNEYQQKKDFPWAFVCFAVLVLFISIIIAAVSANVPATVEKATSSQVSNAIFSFDEYKPYTLKSSDGSYEYDCYTVNKTILSNLWTNPPRYFIYNNTKYEVDNKNYQLDYDDAYNAELNKYNVTIYWGNYDGTYYHFLGVEIQNGNKTMILQRL